jgi:hypothetical protein
MKRPDIFRAFWRRGGRYCSSRKTYIATECEWTFFNVNPAAVMSKWIGGPE